MSLRALLPLVAVALAFPVAVFAQDKSDGAKVYKQAVHSVVWVHSERPRGLATGSGSLIDKDRRLVLTNYHVVQDNPQATVFFPKFRDGSLVTERDYYKERVKQLAREGLVVHGRVVALDKETDLAIIRVDSVPVGTNALTLAATSPDPGANVHSIGSAGKSEGLFGYVKGSVRQVYKKEWKAELSPRNVATFKAKVIETDSPTNPGDSGGPLLNDQGELVGVTQGGALNAQLVSTFIDVSEVKRLLNTRAVKEVRADKPTPKKERVPLKVADDAELFSDDARKAANEALAELFKKDVDVLIETHKKLTADEKKLAELKASKTEREAFLKKMTGDRMTAAGGAEIGVVITTEPKAFYVVVREATKKEFADKFQEKLVAAVADGLKAGKPDDALANVIKVIQDNRKGKK